MCPGQGIQKSYPLHNKVTDIVMGKAMSEGFRESWTNVTLMALHVISASQFNSFNWQKNNAGKKNGKEVFFCRFIGLNWLMKGPDRDRVCDVCRWKQPLPENTGSAFGNRRVLRLFQPFGEE